MESPVHGISSKFSRFTYKRPLTRSCRPTCYLNQNKSLLEIKEILKKCIDPSSQPIDTKYIIEATNIATMTKNRKHRLSPNTDEKCDEAKTSFYDRMKIHCKSPIFRIKKSRSKVQNIENNSSLRIQKISFPKFVRKDKKIDIKDNKLSRDNSGYLSYSDIFHRLCVKIPLQ